MWGVGINNSSAVLLATPPEDGGYGFGVNGLGFIYLYALISHFPLL